MNEWICNWVDKILIIIRILTILCIQLSISYWYKSDLIADSSSNSDNVITSHDTLKSICWIITVVYKMSKYCSKFSTVQITVSINSIFAVTITIMLSVPVGTTVITVNVALFLSLSLLHYPFSLFIILQLTCMQVDDKNLTDSKVTVAFKEF